MIEIHIRPTPVIRFEAVEQGWCATALGALIFEKGYTYQETLGKVLVSLVAAKAVDIVIKDED